MTTAKPILGWRPCQWKGAKLDCVVCGKGVRQGICHVNDRNGCKTRRGPAPSRVMCELCYQKIMSPDGAKAPAGTPGFD